MLLLSSHAEITYNFASLATPKRTMWFVWAEPTILFPNSSTAWAVWTICWGIERSSRMKRYIYGVLLIWHLQYLLPEILGTLHPKALTESLCFSFGILWTAFPSNCRGMRDALRGVECIPGIVTTYMPSGSRREPSSWESTPQNVIRENVLRCYCLLGCQFVPGSFEWQVLLSCDVVLLFHDCLLSELLSFE